VLVIDVIVKVVLNCYIRTSKAITSFYNLYIERLYSPSKDTREHYVKLLLLDIYLLVDTKEDLNLIIKQVVCIAYILITIILELRELRNYTSV
jgi:hypothetical protein